MRAIRTIILSILLLAVSVPVVAGPQEGVMAEFRAVEEAIRNKQRSPELLKETLENNLLNAMRSAIMRRFYDEKETILEGISAENIYYENPTSDRIFFVKYKDYIVRFDYSRDPRYFIQRPYNEKFLIIEEDLNVNSSTGGTGGNTQN